MRKVFTTTIVIAMMLIASVAHGTIIHVPGDQPTIQAGIDVAVDGDTVLVADGVYTGDGNKNLDFGGKAITVTSENGAENCIIDCEGDGRGFYFYRGEGEASVVSGFTITNGNVTNFGGGIYCCDNSSPTITNNTITGNSASYGGGIYCCDNSSPTITNNTITENSAGHGGGIYCKDNSSRTITNNIITANSAYDGGGIYCCESSPTITNNTITGNSADRYSGGIHCHAYSSPTITNNTITENSAYEYGGGISCWDYSSPTITNTILWNDSPQEIYLFSSSITVTYSDVQGGWEGEGNIDADPLFVNPENGDYHLQAASPCIDAGTPIGAPPTDKDGNPRDEFPDMGAYEYQGVSTGYIDGLVTDVDTAEPIERALVLAIQLPSKDKFFAPFTDEDGYYDIPDLAPGLYLVIAIKKGYNPGVKIAQVVAGEGTWVEFWLTPNLE